MKKRTLVLPTVLMLGLVLTHEDAKTAASNELNIDLSQIQNTVHNQIAHGDFYDGDPYGPGYIGGDYYGGGWGYGYGGGRGWGHGGGGHMGGGFGHGGGGHGGGFGG